MSIKPILTIWGAAMLCSTFVSCNETACPLNNTVSATFKFYAPMDGTISQVQLQDTLTLTAAGTDSVLINREVGADGFVIPMSYSNKTDTLALRIVSMMGTLIQDTIWIDKDSYPHFESPDCPTVVFHEIKNVRSTHNLIDTVQVVNPNIDYNATENFKILFQYTD